MEERLGETESDQDRLKRQKERAGVEEGDSSAAPSGPKDISETFEISQP